MTDSEKFSFLVEAVARQDKKMDMLEKNLKEVKEDMADIKLVIENEIRRDISIVAEGHLDLSRKLEEAIKGNQERETFMIRLNALETYVKEIRKERTAIIYGNSGKIHRLISAFMIE